VANYLLIESRDPFESVVVPRQYDLAVSLATAGNAVTLFLVQNGVLPARAGGVHSRLLTAASKAGVQVMAEEFSLRERGIAPGKLAVGVRSADLSVVIDQLAEGRKALWH
jgi:DsrE/DsrF/DsrH-like protein